MSTATSELSILVTMKDQATAAMERFSNNVEKAIGPSRAIGVAFLAGGAAVAGFGALAVKAAAGAQVDMARFDTILKNTAGSTEEARKKILEMANAAVRLGFDDETAAVSIAQLYQRTGDLTKATNLNSLAMDLARAKNMGLDEASKMVGLALSGNAKIMKQYGIEIDENKEPIAALIELQDKLKGSAESYGNTFAGQMDVLKAQIGNLMEIVGDKLLPVLIDLMTKINDFAMNELPKWIEKIEEINKWLADHKEILIIVAGAITGALVPAFIAAATTLITVTIPAIAAAALALAPFMIGGLIIGGLVAGIYWIITNWELVQIKATEIWNNIKNYLQDTWDGIKLIVMNTGESIKSFLFESWDIIKKNISEAVGNIKSAIVGGFTEAFEIVTNLIIDKARWISEQVNGIINSIENIPSGFLGSASGAVSSATTWVGNTISGKKNDFIWRPGMAPIDFSNEDTIIGMKNPAALGGITINLSGNNFYTSKDMARELANQIALEIKKQIKI